MLKTATHLKLESPFVVQRSEGCYLFIRHRLLDKQTTPAILYSERPDCFPIGERPWIQQLHHAKKGKNTPSAGGWVGIARLEFL